MCSMHHEQHKLLWCLKNVLCLLQSFFGTARALVTLLSMLDFLCTRDVVLRDSWTLNSQIRAFPSSYRATVFING